MIGFTLPEATEATLTITDETGRQVYNVSGNYAEGYNAVTIEAAQLGNTTGVLYYEVKTATEKAVRKMIVIQK